MFAEAEKQDEEVQFKTSTDDDDCEQMITTIV